LILKIFVIGEKYLTRKTFLSLFQPLKRWPTMVAQWYNIPLIIPRLRV
jgi:hypothetical protein